MSLAEAVHIARANGYDLRDVMAVYISYVAPSEIPSPYRVFGEVWYQFQLAIGEDGQKAVCVGVKSKAVHVRVATKEEATESEYVVEIPVGEEVNNL